MLNFLIVLLSLITAAALTIAVLLYKKLNSQTDKKTEAQKDIFNLLQNQILEMSRNLDQKITETNRAMSDTNLNLNKTIQNQFAESVRITQGIMGQSNKMIADITEKLTGVEKTNQQVLNFSEQLSSLEKVLTNQKKRGNLGEAGLRLVLENIMPPGSFELQYRFDDNDVVDAIIKTKDGLIPVDAKFSLDNYRRIEETKDEQEKIRLEKEFKMDLKKRIDETSKYIKPKYGTMDFAFMFIPAEGIYYDLLVNEVGTVKVDTRSLIDYAFKEKKVIIVSPTTFAAYLQTVLQGLRAFKIEESAKSIRKNVEELGKHLLKYEEFMRKLGVSMSATVNHYNTAYKELGKIDKDVVKITGGEKGVEILELEKPAKDVLS